MHIRRAPLPTLLDLRDLRAGHCRGLGKFLLRQTAICPPYEQQMLSGAVPRKCWLEPISKSGWIEDKRFPPGRFVGGEPCR
jgi:hypothetical protein